jgi:hypothetical protein
MAQDGTATGSVAHPGIDVTPRMIKSMTCCGLHHSVASPGSLRAVGPQRSTPKAHPTLRDRR